MNHFKMTSVLSDKRKASNNAQKSGFKIGYDKQAKKFLLPLELYWFLKNRLPNSIFVKFHRLPESTSTYTQPLIIS